MRILLDTENEKFAKEYIPAVLKDYIIKYFSVIKVKKLTAHLATLGIKTSIRTILLYAIDTLRITKDDQHGYILEVDKNRIFPGSHYNIDTLVRLVTYGTADIKGYNILLKAFSFVLIKLNLLKKIYVAHEEKQEANQ